jgi:hypothetical protein
MQVKTRRLQKLLHRRDLRASAIGSQGPSFSGRGERGTCSIAGRAENGGVAHANFRLDVRGEGSMISSRHLDEEESEPSRSQLSRQIGHNPDRRHLPDPPRRLVRYQDGVAAPTRYPLGRRDGVGAASVRPHAIARPDGEPLMSSRSHRILAGCVVRPDGWSCPMPRTSTSPKGLSRQRSPVAVP